MDRIGPCFTGVWFIDTITICCVMGVPSVDAAGVESRSVCPSGSGDKAGALGMEVFLRVDPRAILLVVSGPVRSGAAAQHAGACDAQGSTGHNSEPCELWLVAHAAENAG